MRCSKQACKLGERAFEGGVLRASPGGIPAVRVPKLFLLLPSTRCTVDQNVTRIKLHAAVNSRSFLPGKHRSKVSRDANNLTSHSLSPSRHRSNNYHVHRTIAVSMTKKPSRTSIISETQPDCGWLPGTCSLVAAGTRNHPFNRL